MAEKLAEELLEKNVKLDPSELANLDTNKLIELQVAQLEKERKDLAQKTKLTAKRMDHLERAFRKEETSLLEKDYHLQQKQDRDSYELKKRMKIEEAKLKHKSDMIAKERMSRLLDDYKIFKKQLDVRRDAAFAALKAENDQKLEQAKIKRAQEVKERIIAEQKRKEEQAEKYFPFDLMIGL